MFSYCSPKRKGDHKAEVEIVAPAGQGKITYRFNAAGFKNGCSPKHRPTSAARTRSRPRRHRRRRRRPRRRRTAAKPEKPQGRPTEKPERSADEPEEPPAKPAKPSPPKPTKQAQDNE